MTTVGVKGLQNTVNIEKMTEKDQYVYNKPPRFEVDESDVFYTMTIVLLFQFRTLILLFVILPSNNVIF